MKFRSEVQLNGKTATGLPVPAKVVADLDAGQRPKVLVTISGYTYRSSIAPWGGHFMIPLSAEHRTGAGVAPGDKVQVTVELDSAPRVVEIPPDFAKALTADPVAKEFFDGLSFSNKRVHTVSIEGAKTSETRQRRIEKSVGLLREGRVR